MKNTVMLLASAIALTAAPVYAAVATGQVIGTTEPVIRAALESNGYVVQSLEMEGDEIEVDALFNGSPVEIEISVATGAVMEIETEDDQDDDDDDENEDDDD